MLDFKAVREGRISFADLVADLERDDLRDLTNEMVDTVLGLIADCVDADVAFPPEDPGAHDPYAATPEEVDLAWNLGHVIVHITASSEESAAIAAEWATHQGKGGIDGEEDHQQPEGEKDPMVCASRVLPRLP